MPNRAHFNDAGADVFVNLNMKLGDILEDNITKSIVIKSGETVKIPLGIGIEIPFGYMAVVYSKSGLASKGIQSLNAPIDSSYTGEIHAIVSNVSDKAYMFVHGDKVGQLVIHPISICDFTEFEFSGRGEKGFGSTGK